MKLDRTKTNILSQEEYKILQNASKTNAKNDNKVLLYEFRYKEIYKFKTNFDVFQGQQSQFQKRVICQERFQ